jgi:hypothetical protein
MQCLCRSWLSKSWSAEVNEAARLLLWPADSWDYGQCDRPGLNADFHWNLNEGLRFSVLCLGRAGSVSRIPEFPHVLPGRRHKREASTWSLTKPLPPKHGPKSVSSIEIPEVDPMKHLRGWTALLASGLFACLSVIAFGPQAALAESPLLAATYLITNVDSTGAFASRSTITLHPDHSLTAVDSGEGGPTFFFSSQQGTWGFGSGGAVIGRTVDFDFAPDNDVVRLDYTFKFNANGTVSGTTSIYYFPQTANPLGAGGTFGGTFTFTGYLIKP